MARIPSPCVFDVETYFYLLIDLYNILVIDRSPSPGDNILQPTGKHFKRIPRARYPGYQRFFLCLGMLRCRSQCRRIFGQRPKQRVAMKTYDRNRKPRTLEVSSTQDKGSYDYENFAYLKFCFSMLPVFIHELYTETIIVHFLSDLRRP